MFFFIITHINLQDNIFALNLTSLIFKCSLQMLRHKNNNYVYPYIFHSGHLSTMLDLICVSKSKINLFSEVIIYQIGESDHQL